MPQNQITLPPIYVGAEPISTNFTLGGWSTGRLPGMGEMMQFGPFIMRAVTEWDAQFKNGLSLIDSNLSQELGAARGGRPENTSTVEGIQRELDLRHQLSERRRSEIQQLSSAADQFYGGDPLALTLHQQVNKAILRMGRSRNQEEIYRLAQASHEAAYKRRFAVEALGRLNQQTAALRARLADVQRAQAEAAARAAAQRAQAEAAARAEAERAQAEAAARAEAERAQAEAAARAEAEQAQAEAAEAERSRKEELLKQVAKGIFQFSGTAGSPSAQLLTTAGRILAAEGSALTLQAAIRSSVGALGSVASGFLVGVGALVYSSELGNGELPERYALSLPLSELGELSVSVQNTGTVEVPVRLGFRPSVDEQTEVIAIPADGVHVSSSVRVITATYDAARNVYSASTPDDPERTLIWTPIVHPGDSSTALPVESPPAPVYEGATFVPSEGRIETYPELADAQIDDYIFVFPADSGLPPLYVVFRSRRDMPGAASGEGQDVSTGWLGLTEGGGAPIPKQIADQLRGRTFSSFSQFRGVFWKLVAADEMLVPQFSILNLDRMRRGYSPVVTEDQRVGRREVLEIHHINHISKGGGVYSMDNLVILTPKEHIKLHARVKHG